MKWTNALALIAAVAALHATAAWAASSRTDLADSRDVATDANPCGSVDQALASGGSKVAVILHPDGCDEGEFDIAPLGLSFHRPWRWRGRCRSLARCKRGKTIG